MKRRRATGGDIAELFGYAPDDMSLDAKRSFESGVCPFTLDACTKRDHTGGVVYGVCSVTGGRKRGSSPDVIVCPSRLYAGEYAALSTVARDAWGNNFTHLIVGGQNEELRAKALKTGGCIIAFGHRSGGEIAAGDMSMDWALQRYAVNDGKLVPIDFICVEVQSIDTTGNYREPWLAYEQLKRGCSADEVPDSSHGLNWANVHKRMMPQLIRKGNIMSRAARARGFYFVTPDIVFKRFEGVLQPLQSQNGPARDRVSIFTWSLGAEVGDGTIRSLSLCRTLHYDLHQLGAAFISYVPGASGQDLDQRLMRAL